ncbi:IS110 family transposase [Micromonospora tulbaghiae]|uniref:IS110 family transposase n=1 Tax=Micromonospora TaxID=1873 RepID=UPI003B970B6E
MRPGQPSCSPNGTLLKYHAGLDWGESHHDLAVVDDHGRLITHTRLPDNPEGLAHLLAVLAAIRRNRRSIPIGIETGRGLMVAGLLKAGQPVVVPDPTRLRSGCVQDSFLDGEVEGGAQRGAQVVHRGGGLGAPLLFLWPLSARTRCAGAGRRGQPGR